MAVGYVSIGEIIDSNSGTPESMDMNVSFTKNFLIEIDDKILAHATAIVQCPQLPQLGAFYRSPLNDYFNQYCLCAKRSAKILDKDDWSKWIATLEYTTKSPSGGPRKPGQQDNPQDEPPSVHWEAEVVQKAFPFDLDGKPFTNSARVAYKPAPTIEIVRPVLVFTRNELTFGTGKIDLWGMKSNNRVLMERPPGCARCNAPTAEQLFHGGLLYWKVTYRIVFGALFKIPQKLKIRDRFAGAYAIVDEQYAFERMDVLDLLDEGFMKLEAGGPQDGKPVNIQRNGNNISTPVPLDGLGHPIDYANVGPNLPEVYNRFKVTASIDLNMLLDGPNFNP